MALRDAVEAGKALKLDEMSETQQEVEAWIAAVTGKPFDAPFAEHLHDGRVLCELMNVIEPGSVKKINSSKLAFKQMENVSNFTRAMKKLGVRETDCFDTIDLFEAHDIAKVSASRRGPRIGLELATRRALSPPAGPAEPRVARRRRAEARQVQRASARRRGQGCDQARVHRGAAREDRGRDGRLEAHGGLVGDDGAV